ncbi:MAG: ABC transporter substrate-binding protein [Burkholderiales bacterium]|nr:ABC transporter substrate-binding protein [Burkholderiales bacterium]
MIDRRCFLGALGAAPVAVAYAQARTPPRIGLLTLGPNVIEPAFLDGMRELGYVDGKTIALERRSAEGDQSKLPALAEELVRLRPAVIVSLVTAASIAASRATSTIPVVIVAVGDPVAAGIVGNLARPGRNVTGTSAQSTAVIGKLIQIIRQLLPRAAQIGMLWNPANAIFNQQILGEALTSAARLQLFARVLEARSRDDIDRAFAAMSAERPDALLVFLDPLFAANAGRVAELALAQRLPWFVGSRPLAQAGGLVAYGSDLLAIARRTAAYVQKILKGAKPGDLPIEQPTKFDLIVNLRAAKALDIEVPPALLARADEVIR